MTKYNYIYLFPIGNKIVHSRETAESLLNRATTDEDRDALTLLIECRHVGGYTSLSTGEFAVQVSES
jgi:hypothetical protein